MCTFCDDIYPENDTKDIVFGRGKYKNVAQGGTFINPDAFIVVDHDGDLDIVTNPGDPYELGLVCDIKFCPYCGRKLKSDLEKVSSCSECEFFSDTQFYADNNIFVSWGSCMKCQRNMATINPYQEIPTWCPLKGDEDGND